MSVADSTRITEGARSEIKSTVGQVMGYLRRTNPYPARERLLDVHAACFNPEVLQAAKTIWKFPEMRTMVRNATYANLAVNVPTDSQGTIKMTFTVHFPHKTFVNGLGSNEAPPMDYNHPYFAETVAWAKKCVEINHQIRAVTTLVAMVLDKCTTYGQLARLWPMLVNAVPSEFKTRLANAKRQTRISPYPWIIADRIDDYRDALKIVDEWLTFALLYSKFPSELETPWLDNYANIPCPVLIDRVQTKPFTLFDAGEWPWSQ